MLNLHITVALHTKAAYKAPDARIPASLLYTAPYSAELCSAASRVP